jgi:hypothetical protein
MALSSKGFKPSNRHERKSSRRAKRLTGSSTSNWRSRSRGTDAVHHVFALSSLELVRVPIGRECVREMDGCEVRVPKNHCSGSKPIRVVANKANNREKQERKA